MNASSSYGPDHSLLRAVLVLLGGAEWLAAAYALNRLRERESTDDGSTDDESGEGSPGTS